MHSVLEDYTALSMKQIVAAYNLAQDALGRDGDSHVKKFRDQKTGVDRLRKIRADLEAMHGYAVLRELEDQTLEWIVQKPQPPKVEDNPPEMTSDETGSPAPVQRVGATTLDLTGRLEVLVEDNPKRPGSRAWGTFEVYWAVVEKDSDDEPVTGEDFVSAMVDAGYTRKLALSTLHWDIDHGFVRLGKSEVPEQEKVVEEQSPETEQNTEEQ